MVCWQTSVQGRLTTPSQGKERTSDQVETEHSRKEEGVQGAPIQVVGGEVAVVV